MQDYAFKAKLPPIQIVELSPEFVYENYLSGAKITKELTELLEKKNDVVDSDKKEEFLSVAENPNIVKKKFTKNQQSSIYDIHHI